MPFDSDGRWRPLVAILIAAATLLLTVGDSTPALAAAREVGAPPHLVPRAFDAICWFALAAGIWLANLVATRSPVTRIMLGIWLVAVSLVLLAPRSTLQHPLGLLTAIMAYILAPVVWALDGAPRNDQHWARFHPTTSRRSI